MPGLSYGGARDVKRQWAIISPEIWRYAGCLEIYRDITPSRFRRRTTWFGRWQICSESLVNLRVTVWISPDFWRDARKFAREGLHVSRILEMSRRHTRIDNSLARWKKSPEVTVCLKTVICPEIGRGNRLSEKSRCVQWNASIH